MNIKYFSFDMEIKSRCWIKPLPQIYCIKVSYGHMNKWLFDSDWALMPDQRDYSVQG